MNRLALGAALLPVALWGSDFVGIRAVASEISPGPLALATLTVAGVALSPFVAVRPWPRLRLLDIGRIGASGLLWFAAYNLALNAAEHSVDAGTAAMLVSTGPILIALLAGIFLGEGFPPRLLLGCGVAFTGAVIIGAATSSSAGGHLTTGWGVALCMLAALAYAGGVTLQKSSLARASPLHVTWLGCLAGVIVCLPFTSDLIHELSMAGPANIGWLLYLGLFPTAIGSTSWAFALDRTPAGHLGAMTYLVPPVAVSLAALILRELPTPLAFLGGLLCLGGVLVARSTWSPRHDVPEGGRSP